MVLHAQPLKNKPSVLITAYRRNENLQRIIEICVNSGFTQFFISIDGLREFSEEGQRDQNSILETIDNFKRNKDLTLNLRTNQKNFGCGVSVFSACAWALGYCEELIVLEDDCIPNDVFFEFSKYAFKQLELDEDLLLFCGTQFVPENIQRGRAAKSKYALTWGWGTNKNKWIHIYDFFLSCESFPLNLFNSNPEKTYWSEGARRAIEGYVDVWDTVLLNLLDKEAKYALLPPANLVSNIGNDAQAVHTKKSSSWLNRATQQSLLKLEDTPSINVEADIWLKNNLYQISRRHLFTTRLTRFYDHYLRRSQISFKQKFIDSSKLSI